MTARLGRFALWVIAAIVALIGLGAVPAGAMAPTDDSATLIYAYDTRIYDVSENCAETDRGPPSIGNAHTTRDAVGPWSHGSAARPDGPAALPATTYDYPATLVPQVAGATTTTGGYVPFAGGDVSPLLRLPVAAKACSLTGATVVLMADGSHKPIEDVEVGDKVIATDPETSEQVAKTVEHVFVHDDTVTDKVIDGEVITTTEDHPFWSVTDQRFERADELSPGVKVLSADGRLITISGLMLGTTREELAYNLSVEGIHTYHVGSAEILVHNESTCDVRGLWQITEEGTAATDM